MAKAGTVKDKSWGTLGGNGKMHSFRGAGEQTAGQSSQEVSGNAGRREQKAQAGGTGIASSDYANKKHGSNRYYAGTNTPGQSSADPSGGRGEKFAKGGTTSMFGNRGSIRAEAGKSSP